MAVTPVPRIVCAGSRTTEPVSISVIAVTVPGVAMMPR